FFCHELVTVLVFLLDKEKRKTGLKPFYVMGMVERDGKKAEHCWVELRSKKKERLLLDVISNVIQPLDEKQNYITSQNGIKYLIDNGPLILRKKGLMRRLKEI
ncbi:MAG: hypothetical protein QXL94_05345, partial [Candidatus Parvarchaeum sp.]